MSKGLESFEKLLNLLSEDSGLDIAYLSEYDLLKEVLL